MFTTEDTEDTEPEVERVNRISEAVIGCAIEVHRFLGPGLLESVYEEVLAFELRKRDLKVLRQVPIPLVYESMQLDLAFVADLLVEDLVIVELKSMEKVAPVHKKQLLTYLRLADKKLGLLINFGEALIKNGISRVVNGL